MAQVLELQLQHQSFKWIFGTDIPLPLTGLISLQSKGLSRIFNITVQKHQFFSARLSLWSNSHIHTWHWKNHSFDCTDLCRQSNVSAFYMLSRLVIAFLPRSKCLNFMAAVTICSDFGAQKHKVSHCFPIYLLWSDGAGCHHLHFSECWDLSQLFHSPLSLSSSDSLVTLHYLHHSTLNSFRECWRSTAEAA